MSTLLTMRLSLAAGLILLVGSGAASQQVGPEDIARQMLLIIEQRLDTAGVRLTKDESTFVAELVVRGADRIYERNALSEVVRDANALADRITRGSPSVLHADVCPLPPFC